MSAWFPASAFGGGASTGQRAATPEIVDWEHLDHGELGATWRLVAEDAGGPDWWPGMAVTCSGGVLGMWAFFGPGTGFHVPVVEARTDIIRVLAAVAVTDSLVSNGHYSFWNRASPLDNRELRLFAQGCR